MPPETLRRISTFLDRFVDADKPLSEQLDMFSDDVEYYDQGQIGKKQILRDMERYRRQWPSREYRVSLIDFVFPDPASDRIYVRYEVEFEVANPQKLKKISGRGMYGAVIEDIKCKPQVASIQESVIARKRASGSRP